MKKKFIAPLLGIAVLLCGLFLMNARQENTASAAENVFEMTPGGSIRIAEPYGLRFQVRMSADIKESADKVGMLIFPADYLDDSGADGDVYYESVEALADTSVTKHRMDLDLTSKIYEKDDYWYGNGAIVNIKGNNMAREFVGIAYYEVDGEKIFADTGKIADTTRSAAQVALLSSSDKNNTYAEETNKLLSGYMDYLKAAEVEDGAPSRYKVRGFAADNGLRFHVEQYMDNLVSTGNAWTEQTHLEAQVWQHNIGKGVQYGFSTETYCAFWLDGSSWFNDYTNIKNVTNQVTVSDRGEGNAEGYRYEISYDIFVEFDNNLENPADGPYAFVQFKHHMPGEEVTGFENARKEHRDDNRYLWQDKAESVSFGLAGMVEQQMRIERFAEKIADRKLQWEQKGNDGKTTLFIGDSFFDTDFWSDFYTSYYGGKDALLLGIGSTTTYDWETWAAEWLKDIQPKNIVMHVGTNNIYNNGDDVEATVLALQDMFAAIHENVPDTPIYWFGISYRSYGDARIAKSREVNAQMKTWCEGQEYITYIDTPDMLTTDMLSDGIHPKVENYYIFANALKETNIEVEDKMLTVNSDAPTRYAMSGYAADNGLHFHVEQYVDNLVSAGDAWTEQTHFEAQIWQHNMGQGAEHGFSTDTYCAFWLDGSSWFNNYTNIQNVTNDVTIVDRGEDYADGYRYAISYDIFINFDNNVGSADGPYAYVQFKHHMPGETEKGFANSCKEHRDGNRYLWQDSCNSYEFRENGIVNRDDGEVYSTEYTVVANDNEAKYSWVYKYRVDGLKVTVDVTDEEIYDSASNFGYNDNIEFTIQKNTVADSLDPNNSFNVLVTLGESDQKWARYANGYSSYGDNIYSNLSNNGIVKVEKTVKENGVIVEIFLDYSIWGIDYNQAVGNMTTLMASRNGDAQGNSLFRFFERQGAIWNKANTASRIEKNGKLVNNYYELPDMEELVKTSTEYQEGETLDNSMAVLSASNKKALIREYKQGAQLFTNRDYMVHEDGLPTELIGKSFFRFNIDEKQVVKVEETGYVIAAAPGEGSFGDSIATCLLNNGFVKIADDMPVIGYISTSAFTNEAMAYYVKWCEAGETYEFTKWCVLIFASQDEYEADYWMSNAATVIKLDTKEMKEKYAPSTRLWQGIPSITSVETENGTRLWATWFTGEAGEPNVGNYAVYYYSDDNGENWNPAFVATFNYDVVDNSRVYDPTIFTDNDNNLYLWWNQTNYSFGSGSVWYSIIENADGDFSDMKAKTPVNTSTGLKLNKPIILSTGEWLYVAHDMYDRTAAKVYSSLDKGVTWTLKGAAVICNANNFFESTIAEVLDDGSDDVTLMMWNRCTESYMRSISYSYDGGKTWSEAEEFVIEGTLYQGPSSRQNSLAFTYNGKNYIAYAHHYNTESRNNMCLFLSDDGGKTFAYRMMLDRNSGVSYPDIRYVDETLYVVWDYNRYNEKRVFMAEIAMEDLLASTGLQEIDPANIKVISSLTVDGMTLNLSGTVTDANGNPIVGATVVVGENAVTTNQDGYYSFKNIDADLSVITVSKEGYFSQEINVTDKELIDSEFNYVANVSLESKQNVNVTGNVVGMYGEAISGAKVSLDETEVTTTNGTFEFENIVPKEDANYFTLTIEKEGYATRSYQIAYGEFTESNNYCVNLQDCKLLTEGTTDLGLLGGTGVNGSNTANIPEYQVYLTRNDTGVVIEAITDSKLTSGGLDRLEIFMNVHNYSTSVRGAQTVLFNFFSSGLIRVWNYPNAKSTQLYTGNVFNSWQYQGTTVKNTVTISDTGKNKFVIEIPYAFFDLLLEQQFGLEGLSANYSKDKYGVGKNTPLGISMLSGYKVNNSTWYSDSWYYNDIPDLADKNIGTIVYKNYPSDLAIVTPECTVAQKYSVYAESLLSSFDALDSYVQTTKVAVAGKTLANNMAKYDATGHTLVKFEPGQYIFSNRTAHVVPDDCTEALEGLTFIYDPVDAVTTVKITQSGYLLLMVDDNALTSEYLKDWNCIIRSSVTKHGIGTGGRGVSMYAIWAEEGDTITIPTNAVIFTNNM